MTVTARYLDAWFDAVGLDRVVLVGHDWGGALAFDWAARHPERVLGIAFAESIVKPMGWDELSPQARARGEKIRGAEGENLYLDQNRSSGRRSPAACSLPSALATWRPT